MPHLSFTSRVKAAEWGYILKYITSNALPYKQVALNVKEAFVGEVKGRFNDNFCLVIADGCTERQIARRIC